MSTVVYDKLRSGVQGMWDRTPILCNPAMPLDYIAFYSSV